MRCLRPVITISATILIVLEMLGCGSGPRQLDSITISPASADAQSYPNGQVPFAATGKYTKAPTTAPLQPALWSVYLTSGQQTSVTISQQGVAACAAGVIGNFTILAYAPADPSLPLTSEGLRMAKKAAVGTAQITCP